jgi:hypothetical protein
MCRFLWASLLILALTEFCEAQQVISARQRYVLHIPERLVIELSPAIIRTDSGRITLQQQVHIQTQPADGIVLAVSVQEEGRQVAAQDVEVPAPVIGPPRLIAVAGQIQWVRSPQNTDHFPAWGGNPLHRPTATQLEVEVDMTHPPNSPAQTAVLTITPLP